MAILQECKPSHAVFMVTRCPNEDASTSTSIIDDMAIRRYDEDTKKFVTHSGMVIEKYIR